MNLLLFLPLMLFFYYIFALPCNSTLGSYISPYSLGQQDQMNDTISILCPKLTIKPLTYALSSTSYTLSNITLSCLFYDGSQTSEIHANRSMRISGGKIQFLINFNYSILKPSSTQPQKGTAFASTITLAPNFTKMISFDNVQHTWYLVNGSTDTLKISPQFQIKRIQPSGTTPEDKTNLNSGLNQLQGNILDQITQQINSNLTQILNRTLRQETVFNDTLHYKYQHYKKGQLVIKYINNLKKLRLDPSKGFILKSVTVVEGYPTNECTSDIPDDPRSYTHYGGIQSVIHTDVARQTIKYILDQKWLDVELDGSWDVNAFQFYAGDLYDVMSKVKATIPPRTRLAGSCVADSAVHEISRYFSDKYQLRLKYTCQLITETNIKVLQFEIDTKYILLLKLNYETLSVNIHNVEVVPIFRVIDGYTVESFELASYKIQQVLLGMRGMSTFGSQYPTWPRDHPNLEITQDYIFLYDSSQISHGEKTV